MNKENTNLSRRNFLKASASIVAAVGAVNLLKPAFAIDNSKLVKVSKDSIPTDAVECAKSSELVAASWKYLLNEIGLLKDTKLKKQIMDIYNNTFPSFALQYATKDKLHAVYNELKEKGLVDPAITPVDKLLPDFSITGQQPQPFYSAPGSGYKSHHSYPGGLVTHTAVNVQITKAILASYKDIMNYESIEDTAIAGQLLHDLAKPYVFQWKADGSSLPEFQIAGTGAHHIFSIAESLYRGIRADVVVAQACAHNHPGSEKDEAIVVNYIKAAAILANVDPIKAGVLTKDLTLPTPHQQAGYIVHLGDHDFVLSVPAAQKCVEVLKQVAKKEYGMSDADLNGAKFNNFRNYIAAQYSFMHLNDDMSRADPYAAVKKAVSVIIR